MARPHAALALAALVAASPAAGAEPLELELELGPGLDTNPTRVAGGGRPAGLLNAAGRLRAGWSAGPVRLALDWSEGGRLHAGVAGAGGSDAVASRLDLLARAAWSSGLSLAAAASGSHYAERDGALDRSQARGAVTLSLDRRRLGAALDAGWMLFAPGPAALRPFRSDGPEAWLRGRWTPVDGLRLGAAAGWSRPSYRSWARIGAGAPARRTDTAWSGRASLAWESPVVLSADWTVTRNGSDVAGGAFRRQRLGAAAAVELPADLTLAARLTLQWTRYPDPVLAPQAALAAGPEGLDALDLRLSRPLGEQVDLLLSAGWTGADGAGGAVAYRRLTAWLGLAWRPLGDGEAR